MLGSVIGVFTDYLTMRVSFGISIGSGLGLIAAILIAMNSKEETEEE